MATGTRRHDVPSAPVVPPAPATVDLHAHSRRSDGVLEPLDLVADVVAAGVRFFSLTDHDTLAGYRQVVAAGVPAGLELVPGVEINAVVEAGDTWEGELHVIGLGVDPDDDAFEALLAAQRGERRRRFERILARLRDLGLGVDGALEGVDLTDDDALGRPTVARALMTTGHAESVEDAFRRILGHGMPGYVPRGGVGPVAAIHAVRSAGGLPVLAHFREAPDRLAMLRELVDLGLGGLEVYYLTFDAPTVAALEEVAGALRVVPSGGTDYHGDLGSYAEAHAGLWVPPTVAGDVRGALAGSAA